MNINSEVVKLLNHHGYKVTYVDEKILIHFKEDIGFDSRVTITHRYENACTSRLDVKFTLPNGQVLFEAFGDMGKNEKEAKINNIKNFIANSFHVILSCLNEDKEDEQIVYENWQVGGQNWDVYIGNFATKTNIDVPINIPENLFQHVEDTICNCELVHEYHWVRVFVAQDSNEISAVEFLINNEENQEGKDLISKLSWEKKDEYYSIRNFLMMRKTT